MSLKQISFNRARLKSILRDYFSSLDYVEVDTPIAVDCPGTEFHLDYFKTGWIDHRNFDHLKYLRSSPELHMKVLLCEGMERIFQIAPCFRNGGELSDWHNPEFTMLEWYRVGVSYLDFMDETIELLRFVKSEMKEDESYLPNQFERFTVAEAFKEFASLDLVDGDPEFWQRARAAGVVSVSGAEDFETTFFKVMLEKLEPAFAKLGGVILYDYPASQAALARVELGVARRFEVYVNGIELCNAFHELTHFTENRERYSRAMDFRRSVGKDTPHEEKAFVAALKNGLPDSCGNALGFDRLLAMALGHESLTHAIPFHQFEY